MPVSQSIIARDRTRAAPAGLPKSTSNGWISGFPSCLWSTWAA